MSSVVCRSRRSLQVLTERVVPPDGAMLAPVTVAAQFAASMRCRFLVAAICLTVCGACATADSLFVVRRGWHIDVGFAVGELATPMTAMAAEFPGGRYVIVGLGDRRYLTGPKHGAPQMLRALWPGEGLILATGLSAEPAAAFGAAAVVELRLSRQQLLRAQSFVWNSLTREQREKLGHGATEKPGPYAGSVYLDTGERYSAFHTCNTWAAETLSSAGLPLHHRGVIFAGPLWRKVATLAADEGDMALQRAAVSR